MSDAAVALLVEQVKELQEDVQSIRSSMDAMRLSLDVMSRSIVTQFQTGLEEMAGMIGEHLAVQGRRIDDVVNLNLLREQGETLARIENKLDYKT